MSCWLLPFFWWLLNGGLRRGLLIRKVWHFDQLVTFPCSWCQLIEIVSWRNLCKNSKRYKNTQHNGVQELIFFAPPFQWTWGLAVRANFPPSHRRSNMIWWDGKFSTPWCQKHIIHEIASRKVGLIKYYGCDNMSILQSCWIYKACMYLEEQTKNTILLCLAALTAFRFSRVPP